MTVISTSGAALCAICCPSPWFVSPMCTSIPPGVSPVHLQNTRTQKRAATLLFYEVVRNTSGFPRSRSSPRHRWHLSTAFHSMGPNSERAKKEKGRRCPRGKFIRWQLAVCPCARVCVRCSCSTTTTSHLSLAHSPGMVLCYCFASNFLMTAIFLLPCCIAFGHSTLYNRKFAPSKPQVSER